MDVLNLVKDFEEAAIIYGIATEEGKRKKADRATENIDNIYNKLKLNNNAYLLADLLKSDNKYVQLYAAIYTLQFKDLEKNAEDVLNKLVEELKTPGHYGFYAITAQLILSSWRKSGVLPCF